MPIPSLRARVLLGSALWTIGLLSAISGLLVTAMTWHPHVAVPIHIALRHHWIVLAVSAGFMGAGFWHVRKGLSTVDQLRARLSSVHHGDTPRLTGDYPSEIQPLVDDLNALLDQRERTVQRALAKAGDLAHGLKTPLAVLSHEAQRADRASHAEVAASVEREVQRMRRHIDYHLAHARAAASGTSIATRCQVKASADALSRTLLQLHAERGVSIDVRVPPDHVVGCQREDLDEMLGNLLDNACKWARSRVAISTDLEAGAVLISVDDDGPGLKAEMRDTVLQRGARADEATPGTGLGLAIVRDLAELYEGSIELDSSPEGGLRARLRLPVTKG